MRIARIVPWSCQEEWEQVKTWLYSEVPELRLYGVNRVIAWLSRGRVPNAVTSTSTLVQIIHRDQLNALSEMELRSLYTLAIVRFVNGMVDVEQTKVHAQSVSLLADKLGIPLWLVDLRHAGTHDRLPSLHYLRLAADFLLQWLFDNYWNCQPSSNEQTEACQRLIKEFSALTSNNLNDSLMLEQFVSSISNENLLHLFIPMLLETGALVPNDPKACPKFPNSLSSSFIEKWSPLLLSIFITYPNFLECLMDSLLSELVQVSWESTELQSLTRPSHELDCLYAWSLYLIGLLKRKDKTSHFNRWAIQCLSCPNQYTRLLFERFNPTPNPSTQSLLNTFFPSSSSSSPSFLSAFSLSHPSNKTIEGLTPSQWTRVYSTKLCALGLELNGQPSELSLSVPSTIKGLAVDSVPTAFGNEGEQPMALGCFESV